MIYQPINHQLVEHQVQREKKENIVKRGKAVKKPKTKRGGKYIESSSSEEDDEQVVLESDGVSETFSDLEENKDQDDHSMNTLAPVIPEDCVVDNFVVVYYNGEKYHGRITNLLANGPTVECLERKLKFWRWPEKKDTFNYGLKDVLSKINPLKMAS